MPDQCPTEQIALKTRFDEHEKAAATRYERYDNDFGTLEMRLDALSETKVSYKHFTWVLGILMTIVLGSFGYIANQNHDLQVSVRQLELQMARMESIFKNYDIEVIK